MARIQPIDPSKAHPEGVKMLDAAKAKLGMVPNLFATLAHSPAALGGYLQQRQRRARHGRRHGHRLPGR